MGCILGIDLGTSSVKAMLLDAETGVIGVESFSYSVQIPKTGWAQQDPQVWWDGTCSILERLKTKYPQAFADIQAAGLSGQMHGLVALDKDGMPLCPAIIWLDQRSGQECSEIQKKIEENNWEGMMQNRVFPGFAFSSLLWLKRQQPELFSRIEKIIQPKDYIRYRLTGIIATEVTDASASFMLDIGRRQWAYQLVEAFGIDSCMLPECHESMEQAGCITKQAQMQTGLLSGIPVIYGAGDQQCQSIGNGVISQGQAICNIGTGGQISVFSKEDHFDRLLRTHTFCHCFGQAYTIFGAVLCAGMAFNWLKDHVLHEPDFEQLSRKAGQIPPGSGGILFLPYLAGERTPHMNDQASGMFFGLRLAHDERYLARAVMEGVTYALKDSLAIVDEICMHKNDIIASGGACASPVWLQMQADIFERPVKVSKVKEQACLGACILAGTGTRIFSGLAQACEKFTAYDDRVFMPDAERSALYDRQYDKFRALYENVKVLYN